MQSATWWDIARGTIRPPSSAHPYTVISTEGAGSPASAFARWGAEALFAPQWRDPCIRLCSCRVCIECGSTRPPSFTHTNTPSSRPESRSPIARRSGETPVFAFAVALTLATDELLLLGRPRLVTDGFSRGSPWHHTPPNDRALAPGACSRSSRISRTWIHMPIAAAKSLNPSRLVGTN